MSQLIEKKSKKNSLEEVVEDMKKTSYAAKDVRQLFTDILAKDVSDRVFKSVQKRSKKN